MQSQIVGLRVAGVIFGFLCLAHILRLMAGIPMVIGNFQFNIVVSVIAIIFTGCMSIWLWMLSRKQ
jgi:hypothetical protein